MQFLSYKEDITMEILSSVVQEIRSLLPYVQHQKCVQYCYTSVLFFPKVIFFFYDLLFFFPFLFLWAATKITLIAQLTSPATQACHFKYRGDFFFFKALWILMRYQSWSLFSWILKYQSWSLSLTLFFLTEQSNYTSFFNLPIDLLLGEKNQDK